jgi:L-histidine N-alpha-methyltransferase
MEPSQVEIEVHLDPESGLASRPEDVREGLRESPKQIPSKYFYDERGSDLFEEITRLPEYYPTRTELALLHRVAPTIANLTRARVLVELGSGSAKKTDVLIRCLLLEGTLDSYVPFEVSEEITRRTADRLADEFRQLTIHAVVGDYEHHLEWIPAGRRRLFAFLGSTIGNYSEERAIAFLRQLRRQMTDPEDRLLLGTDLIKDVDLLEAAYNDSRGVTAEFNLNILNVLNEQLEGDLDPDGFSHEAFFNEEQERIEMHLRSRRQQSARLGALNLDLSFERGERIRTEISCKYDRASVERLFSAAGFRLEHWFTDDRRYFALSLARPVDLP